MKKLLWIKLGALGDLLVAMPSLSETIKKFPNHSLWIMGSKLWLEILQPKAWAQIKQVIVIQRKSTQGHIYLPEKDNWKFSHSQPLNQTFSQIDVAINLQFKTLRYAWPLWKHKIPITYGSCHWSLKWLYTHWASWLGKEPVIHERDRLLRLIEAKPTSFFSLRTTSKSRKHLLTEQNQENNHPLPLTVIKTYPNQPGQSKTTLAYNWTKKGLVHLLEKPSLAILAKYNLKQHTYWLINPTASDWRKAWPKENFASLRTQLQPYLQKKHIKLYIIGAPNESKWLKDVTKNHTQIIQPKSIQDLLHIVCGAQQLITNTSSMQFIANSCKTPAFVLMGRALPARWGPLGTNDTFVKGKRIVKRNVTTMEEEHLSYSSITVEQVLKKSLDQLDRS